MKWQGNAGKRSRLFGLLAVSLGLLVSSPVGAQKKTENDSLSAVDEIIVHATRRERRLVDLPAAVSVVGRDEIQLGRPQLTLGESLAGVPGVFTQNRQNFSQDLRISIRGFGARARFGLRGLKLIIDGIPATLPDGQGQVDTLQLSTVDRIEVMRGPSASLYGSAAGGVIRVESEAIPDGRTAEGRIALGSYGYRSYDAKSTGREGSLGVLIGLSHQETGGYRDHSRMQSTVLNSRAEWQIDDDSDLTALLSFVHAPVAEDPGGLKASEKQDDRRAAAPNNLKYNAGERLDQVTGGLRYRHRSGEGHETRVATWYGWRDFQNRLPFENGGAVEFDRFFAGGSVQHEYSSELFEFPNTLLLGFDIETQRDNRIRRVNEGFGQGSPTLDQLEEVDSVRAFIHDELTLPANLSISFSLSFDRLHYQVTDHFPVVADDPDDSGRFDFSRWSPMAALRFSPSKAANGYLRISTSFEPPTTTELRNPDGGGGFNHGLQAQRAVNYELGVKGVLPGRLRYELAAYHIRTRDELIPYEVEHFPGYVETYFRNAGRTERTGLEAMVSVELLEGLTAQVAYTFSRSEFTDYVDGGGSDFAGNRVPGVPEQQFYAELRYLRASGFFAAIEGRYLGEYFANDANTVRAESHGVVDLRMGWEREWEAWRIVPHLSFSNLLDTRYDDNVRLNAGFGRYFEPAPGFEVQGGLRVSYRFGNS